MGDDPALDRGFTVAVRPYTTGTEVARQLHIWEMEIQMKPMRMIMSPTPTQTEPSRSGTWLTGPFPVQSSRATWERIPIPSMKSILLPDRPSDPATDAGDLRRSTNRGSGRDPCRSGDPRSCEESQSDRATCYSRADIPRHNFGHSPLPEPVAADAPEQPWLYGVATWSGVDPRTDFFKVIFQGFSNVYEVRGEGDERRTWRKVLVQKFTSRGDEFDPTQREFEFDGKPFWEYQPDKKTAAENSAPVESNPFAAQ